jgi:N-acetylneuraminic acid mutarotase
LIAGVAALSSGGLVARAACAPPAGHSATLLADGRVLVTVSTEAQITNWAEIYDPATDRWTPTSIQRDGGLAATLLADGRVLLTGAECDRYGPQIYDPRSDTVSTAAAMPVLNGGGYTATLLLSGKVLFTGGYAHSLAQLYDPATNTWTLAAPPPALRFSAQSVLLTDGRVLVAGGLVSPAGPLPFLTSAEIYDPSTNAWSPAGEISANGYQSAALSALATGQAIAAGGGEDGRPTSSTELFEPSTRTWSTTASLNQPRSGAIAVKVADGSVMVVGGQGSSGLPLTSAERFDAVSRTWTVMPGSLKVAGLDESAIPLKNGRILVAAWPDPVFGQWFPGDAQVFDPNGAGIPPPPAQLPEAAGTWTPMPAVAGPFGNYTAYGGGFDSTASATALNDGRVLLIGTSPTAALHSFTVTAGVSAAIYDPARGQSHLLEAPQAISSIGLTATLLRSGKVLVVGDGAQLYDAASDTWSAAGSVVVKRFGHTATLLADGRVLVVGGLARPQDPNGGDVRLASSEIYDPASNRWSSAAEIPVNLGGSENTATLLRDGRVLVVSGSNTMSALYDPKSNRWSGVITLSEPAAVPHTATLLPNGKVLILGGCAERPSFSCARFAPPQLFDPATMSWSHAAPMPRGREGFSATLLPSGLVLVAGGRGPFWVTAGADVYDPTADRWSTTADMQVARAGPIATRLKSGSVLVIGGSFLGNMSSAELYTPSGGGQALASANPSVSLPVGVAIPILAGASLLAAVLYLVGARRRRRR